MIPKVLHYIWVGGNPLPRAIQKNIETWAAANPDFLIVQWDESNIDFSSTFIRRSYKLGYWARVADYARIDILKKHGGIYLDTDIHAIKSFGPLLQHNFFVGLEDDKGTVNNAVIGSVPNHWFLATAITEIDNKKSGLERMDPSVGPELFSSLAKRFSLTTCLNAPSCSADTFIAPKRYFYPYAYDEEYTDACLTSDTYCIHLWEKSWQIAKSKVTWTDRIQAFFNSYPSLSGYRTFIIFAEVAIAVSEFLSGNKRFFSRNLPWRSRFRQSL